MGILGPGMARGILVRAQVGYGYTRARDGLGYSSEGPGWLWVY